MAFSISDEGRCNVDAEAPLDDSDPFCPFGKHYCEINDTTTSASAAAAAAGQSSKSPEELLSEEQRKNRIAEEQTVARQREMAVDTELVNAQNEKCHMILNRLPIEVYINQPLYYPPKKKNKSTKRNDVQRMQERRAREKEMEAKRRKRTPTTGDWTAWEKREARSAVSPRHRGDQKWRPVDFSANGHLTRALL
eukprot:scaffold14449_cov149-Skeletonema_dohrnii-CCMP3373.AAC.1